MKNKGLIISHMAATINTEQGKIFPPFQFETIGRNLVQHRRSLLRSSNLIRFDRLRDYGGRVRSGKFYISPPILSLYQDFCDFGCKSFWMWQCVVFFPEINGFFWCFGWRRIWFTPFLSSFGREGDLLVASDNPNFVVFFSSILLFLLLSDYFISFVWFPCRWWKVRRRWRSGIGGEIVPDFFHFL